MRATRDDSGALLGQSDSRPAWAEVWHLWRIIIPRRSITGRLVYGQTWRRHDGRRWIYKKFNSPRIALNDLPSFLGALPATKVFGKNECQMMRAVKATLLVTALARFTAATVLAGFKQGGKMYVRRKTS